MNIKDKLNIKPIYFEKEGTPLKYHNTLRVLLPAIALLLVFTAVMTMQTNIFIGFLCTIVAMTFLFISRSLKRFKWRGVIVFYVICVLNVIAALIGLIQGDTTYLVSLAGAIALLLCSYIYYSHRRPLFYPYSATEV